MPWFFSVMTPPELVMLLSGIYLLKTRKLCRRKFRSFGPWQMLAESDAILLGRIAVTPAIVAILCWIIAMTSWAAYPIGKAAIIGFVLSIRAITFLLCGAAISWIAFLCGHEIADPREEKASSSRLVNARRRRNRHETAFEIQEFLT